MSKFLSDKTKDFIFKASAVLILIAAVVYMFNQTAASYTMIIGVAGFALTTFFSPYPGKSIRGKRLYNIQIFGIVFMVMSTYFMFVGQNAWIVLMLIAAILTLYASVLLPKVYQKELDDEENKKP
ncbi:MAG TPA: hypothetical protein DIT04_00060 [Dysgonomonas sp.]|nr:hypothetical protein [Dysgonomonas sp.]